MQKGTDRAGARRARHRGPRHGAATQPGFEDLRQAEARRQRLPAAGRLPARARGRDRQDDRPDRTASGGAQVQLVAARATSSSPTRRKPATAAVLLGSGSERIEPGAVRGIANLVASRVQGLKTDDVTITDGSGHDAVAAGRRQRRRRRRPLTKPRPRRATTPQMQAQLDRDARPTLGAGQGAGRRSTPTSTSTRPTQEKLTYAKKGTPLQADDRDRDAQGHAAARGRRPRRHRGQPAQLRRHGGAGAGGNSTTRTRRRRRTTASTRPSRTTQVAAGRGQPPGRRRRCVDKAVPADRRGRPASALSQRRRHRHGARRHAHRQRRSRSPSPPRPPAARPARSRPARRLRSSTSPLGLGACCSSSSSPATCAGASATLARRADLAARDRSARRSAELERG